MWEVEELFSTRLPDQTQHISIVVDSVMIALRCVEVNAMWFKRLDEEGHLPSFQLWNGRKCVWERSLLKNVERTAPPTSQNVGRLSMSDKSEIKLIAKCHGVTEKNLMTALRFYSMVSSIESLERLEHSHELVTSLSVQVFPGALQTEQKVGGWREALEN